MSTEVCRDYCKLRDLKRHPVRHVSYGKHKANTSQHQPTWSQLRANIGQHRTPGAWDLVQYENGKSVKILILNSFGTLWRSYFWWNWDQIGTFLGSISATFGSFWKSFWHLWGLLERLLVPGRPQEAPRTLPRASRTASVAYCREWKIDQLLQFCRCNFIFWMFFWGGS